MEKIAVVGSREFSNYKYLEEVIHNLSLRFRWTNENTEFICGGARGADSLGKVFAEKHDIPYKMYLPDWDGLGMSAGMLRNTQMAHDCDVVIAFWDRSSSGTKHMIDTCMELNKRVCVYYYIDFKPHKEYNGEMFSAINPVEGIFAHIRKDGAIKQTISITDYNNPELEWRMAVDQYIKTEEEF